MSADAVRHALYGSDYRPQSKLAEYRPISRSATTKVSPLCLGAMNFGEGWEPFLGPCKKDEAEQIFVEFIRAGGNFIDTAVNYQCGDSEEWLGEFMEKHANREDLVIATKYTGSWRLRDNAEGVININRNSNSRKNLMHSLETSLKRLRTSYVDIYYVHLADLYTSPEEVMQTLHAMVLAGKILYPAISDTPAWMVAQWNTIAKERGWSPFVLYQGHYSIGLRDMEREVLPAVTSLNMSAIPWGVIGGGKYTGKFKRGGQKDEDAKRAGTVMTERDYDIADKVAEVAKRHGATMGQVCIAWTLRQPGINTILIGQRTVKQLKENIAALEIELSEQDLKDLDEVSKIDLGFPNTFLGGTRKEENRFTLTAPGKIVFKNF